MPGSMIVTRTFRCSASWRSDSENATDAPLGRVVDADSRGSPCGPATEETLTMCPPPWSRMIGSAAWVQ